MAISRALWDEAAADPELDLAGDPFAFSFDAEGRLVRLAELGQPTLSG
jgi:hypothetical protein